MARCRYKIFVAVVASAILCLFGGKAFAIEGVTQINSAAVTAQGGYPYRITNPGSYRLTGNLAPGSADGIDVKAGNVTIDLNGFSIIGSGSGIGIGISASGVTAVTVRNGSISAMGGDGISLGDNSAVEDVNVSGNGNGIVIGSGGVVSRVVVSGNSGFGISVVGSGTLVDDCAIAKNTSIGIKIADETSAYARDVMYQNDNNTTTGSTLNQVSGGTQIAQNLCNGAVCP